jgi:hypothetical protein
MSSTTIQCKNPKLAKIINNIQIDPVSSLKTKSTYIYCINKLNFSLLITHHSHINTDHIIELAIANSLFS